METYEVEVFDLDPIDNCGRRVEEYVPGNEDAYALRTHPFQMLGTGIRLKDRDKLPSIPAVYFALSGRTGLLYIGRAKNLRDRWVSHHRIQQLEKYGDVWIGWVSFYDLREEHLPALEAAYIKHFIPPLNQSPVCNEDVVVPSASLNSVEVAIKYLNEKEPDNHHLIVRVLKDSAFARHMARIGRETGVKAKDQILLYALAHYDMLQGKAS